MLPSLFITGGTGFIGRHLLQKIDASKYEKIYCLTRKKNPLPGQSQFEFIQGDICQPDSFSGVLARCETAVHMAAVTGKGPVEQYFRINAEGTRRLVEACQENSVKNFLYVSTIAVKYSEKKRYYYAQSKEQGEQAVKNSRLNYAIVRPTVVLGNGSASWKAFAGLASRPLLFMPGSGQVRIQPIYVDDLAECLLQILYDSRFANEILELGGPEIITYQTLLEKIYRMYHAKEPRVIHIPLKPLISLLSFAESLFYQLLPVNAGQLSAFRNDGAIETNPVFNGYASRMKSIDDMLRSSR